MLLAQRDWLQEKIADGTLGRAYTFPQTGGGTAIANAESGEEPAELITSSPLFAVAQELLPLADFRAGIEAAAQALQRASAIPA